MSSRHQEAWESPGFLLWLATLRWQRLMRATLRPHGLTHVQFVILASLWWLTERGMAPSQRELADHAGTDLTMTGQVLLALERRGLLVRHPDPEDARIRRPGLTERGRLLILRALPAVEGADLLFLEPVGDRDGLAAALRELISKGSPRVPPVGGGRDRVR